MKKYRIEPNRPDPVFLMCREFISVIEKQEKGGNIKNTERKDMAEGIYDGKYSITTDKYSI